MRLCLIGHGSPKPAFYDESRIVPILDAAHAFSEATGHYPVRFPSAALFATATELLPADPPNLLELLPPNRTAIHGLQQLQSWLESEGLTKYPKLALEPNGVALRVPIPRPGKIFLLAGNYADHVRESGEVARERTETFPYVFMKPSTTLCDPGGIIRLPRAAPDAVDWELELAVVIGREAKSVTEAEALNYVAGYTVINDISQRCFRPSPGRKKRDRDAFFDWLHGKWFDTFCPCGPCIVSADAIPEPQSLRMKLELNGVLKQDASTGQQIFPVAAVIEFISRMVTLEPGDIISTGTPAGVGSTTGTFLKPGDVMHAWIEGIGTLESRVGLEM